MHHNASRHHTAPHQYCTNDTLPNIMRYVTVSYHINRMQYLTSHYIT